MGRISTHVLNLVTGLPARNIPVLLEARGALNTWRTVGEGYTNDEGRIDDLLPQGVRIQAGTYRLTFDVAAYFRSQSTVSFYPEIAIAFGIRDATQHHHIPLLIGPFGYTTYRGS